MSGEIGLEFQRQMVAELTEYPQEWSEYQRVMFEERAHAGLARLEPIIEQGLKRFIEVGRALQEIRDKRWYRLTHGTFEGYVAERFGMARGNAYRTIDTARVADAVSPVGDIRVESHARALLPVFREEGAEGALEVWGDLKARERAGERITAATIRAATQRKLSLPEGLDGARLLISVAEQGLRRAAREIRASGHSVEEVAAYLGREPEWVRELLAEYPAR